MAAVVRAVRAPASALRAPLRRMASGAGGEEWRKASRLAEDVSLLAAKEAPSETDQIKLRDLTKQLAKVLQSPLNEGLTLQEIKLSILQEGLNKVDIRSKFHHTIAGTMYGIFGCYVLGLGAAVFEFRLQGNNDKKNLSQKNSELQRQHSKLEKKVETMDSRLTKLELKDEDPSSTGQAEEAETEEVESETEEAKEGWGWVASVGKLLNSFLTRST